MIFKITFIFLSIGYSNYSFGQQLTNTHWVRIKSERKDGSRIIDRSNTLKARLIHFPISYLFYDSVVKISYDGEFSNGYKVTGDTLFIGTNFNKHFIGELFQIDSLSNTFLILTELAPKNVPDDKVNRYYFINRKHYFDYLRNQNKIHFANDTIVACNKLFFPYYNEISINLFLTKQLDPRSIKSTLVKGQLLFNAIGAIKTITVDDNGNLAERQIHRLKQTLLSTSGSWTVPQTNQAYYFNMHFTCKYLNDGIGSTVNIYYNTNDSTTYCLTALANEQITKLNRSFEKGIKYLGNKKYQDAASEFTKCVEIDSYNIDSYYNLAYLYYELGEKEKACIYWKKLNDLEQKQGIHLYNENCH